MITDLEDQFHVNDTLKTSAIGVVKQPRDANRWPWSNFNVFLYGMLNHDQRIRISRTVSLHLESDFFSDLLLELDVVISLSAKIKITA